MKNLFESFFKRKPELDYVVAEYTPIKVDHLRTQVKVSGREVETLLVSAEDEMAIDKLYNKN